MRQYKDKEGFVENVGLSTLTIFFKIGLDKCLKKFPFVKISS